MNVLRPRLHILAAAMVLILLLVQPALAQPQPPDEGDIYLPIIHGPAPAPPPWSIAAVGKLFLGCSDTVPPDYQTDQFPATAAGDYRIVRIEVTIGDAIGSTLAGTAFLNGEEFPVGDFVIDDSPARFNFVFFSTDQAGDCIPLDYGDYGVELNIDGQDAGAYMVTVQ